MNSTSVLKPVAPVKPALQPIGELVGLFPERDPAHFLGTFDRYALSLLKIQKLQMAADSRLPWPPHDPIAFADWLRDNDVRILRQDFLRTERGARWYGCYRLILAIEREVTQ